MSTDGGLTWSAELAEVGESKHRCADVRWIDSKTIYCATGEANISPDCYPGSGIYVSHDTGATWEHAGRRRGHSCPGASAPWCLPRKRRGCSIWAESIWMKDTPADSTVRRMAGRAGMRQDSISKSNYWCHSIALHPDGTVFAALEMRGWRTGIYRCDPGSENWTQLHGGLPAGDKTGRISLAPAPSEADTIYALISDPTGKEVLGLYRSRARGNRWTEIGGRNFPPKSRAATTMRSPYIQRGLTRWSARLNDIHVTSDGGTRGRAPVTGMPMWARRSMCTEISTSSCYQEEM